MKKNIVVCLTVLFSTAPLHAMGPGVYLLSAPVLTNVGSAYAYPVPFKPSAGHTTVKFDHLSPDTTIKVYTIMGALVAKLHNDNNEDIKPWDVTNLDGESVASGVYIYEISSSGSEKHGKLVIIR